MYSPGRLGTSGASLAGPRETFDKGRTNRHRSPPPLAAAGTRPPCASPRARALCAGGTCAGNTTRGTARRCPSTRGRPRRPRRTSPPPDVTFLCGRS